MIRDTARAYAQDKLLPRVTKAYLEEKTDREIFNEMGELGLIGITLPEEYGCANASYVAYGLVAREIERVDSGYRSMNSVQSSLVMYRSMPMATKPAQEIPAQARDRRMGRLLRPDRARCRLRSRRHEDPRREGSDGYKLTAARCGFPNAPIADVFVVWAKSAEHHNQIRGFILKRA
jgi:Acyl-CoA dehydrogenases